MIDSGIPSLREVVSYFEDGSYDVDYYPVGWGLVYFMHNFENERCERVYLKPYRKFLNLYRSGGKHDPFERFVDVFITKPKRRGIKTFDDFEALFQRWIRELLELHFGGEEKAAELLARATEQEHAGRGEAAAESLRWALRKRPNDLAAMYRLALVLAAEKRADEALYMFRRIQDRLEDVDDPDSPISGLNDWTGKQLAVETLKRMEVYYPALCTELQQAHEEFIERIITVSDKYIARNYPRAALRNIQAALLMLGKDQTLDKRLDAIKDEHSVYAGLWRRLTFTSELENWWRHPGAWTVQSADAILAKSDDIHYLSHNIALENRYRFEVRFKLKHFGKDGVFGLTFGSNSVHGIQEFVVYDDATVFLMQTKEESAFIQSLPELKPEQLKDFRLGIDVAGDAARLFVDGKLVGRHVFAPGALNGFVGVSVQDCRGRVLGLPRTRRSMKLADLRTPCALVDYHKVERNTAHMARRMQQLGVRLRPHVKTHKCIEAARLQARDHFGGITVSTLAEAHAFADGGFVDITYAFPAPPDRFDELAELSQRLHSFHILLDQLAVLEHLEKYAARRGRRLSAYLKVDCGDHRAGVDPHTPQAVELAARLSTSPHLDFAGILTHAGHSYSCQHAAEIAAVADEERETMVRFAHRLRDAGIAVGSVSIGSTPTMSAAQNLRGVSETRPGNYVFFDVYQAAIGSCALEDIAFSVLATVVGHYPAQNKLITNAGALALSKDAGPLHVDRDCGFGICAATDSSEIFADLRVFALSQEHGQIRSTRSLDFDRFPLGSRLRIFPNHSCLTAALFDRYHVVNRDEVTATWKPVRGW